MNRAYNKNIFLDREHHPKVKFHYKSEKSTYSHKLCLLYYACQSFQLKGKETTDSERLEKRGNILSLIVLVYRTC